MTSGLWWWQSVVWAPLCYLYPRLRDSVYTYLADSVAEGRGWPSVSPLGGTLTYFMEIKLPLPLCQCLLSSCSKPRSSACKVTFPQVKANVFISGGRSSPTQRTAHSRGLTCSDGESETRE